MSEQEKANQNFLRKWAETGQRPEERRHMIELDESDRQMVVLALSTLATSRPGWKMALSDLSEKVSGREMFEFFMQQRPTDEQVEMANREAERMGGHSNTGNG